jgi:hypothetical protein
MSLTFLTNSVVHEEKTLNCGILELENAVLALFWEGEHAKLGSTTVTLPGIASTQLLGDRDLLLGRVVGTHLSTKFNKMALVSTNLSQGHSESIGKAMLDLIRRITEKKT